MLLILQIVAEVVLCRLVSTFLGKDSNILWRQGPAVVQEKHFFVRVFRIGPHLYTIGSWSIKDLRGSDLVRVSIQVIEVQENA